MNIFFQTNFIFNFIFEGLFIALSIIFLEKIFKTHFSKKNILIYSISNFTCFIIGSLINNYMIGFALTLLTSAIFLYYQKNIFNYIALPYLCIKFILLFTLEICTIKFLKLFFTSYSYLQIMQLQICQLIVLCVISLIEFCVFKLLNNRNFDDTLYISLGTNSKFIIITSICNFVLIFISAILANNILLPYMSIFIFLNFIIYVSLSIIAFYCYKSYKNKQLSDLTNYNNSLTVLYDDTRAFKHDFDNIIQAIGGYVRTKDVEGLTKYYAQISHDCKIMNNLCKLNSSIINNPAIYSILEDKYNLANKFNINLNIDVMMDLNALHAKIYEITRILGILMDNAIEASKDCLNKNINVTFTQDDYKQIITVENTYSNKNISIDKIFEKNFTTKPNNTGLGLWEVNKILKRNENLNLHTNKSDDYFSQQLEIYNN